MGCDIHCYIQHISLKPDEEPYWTLFAEDICLSRRYAIFALLAGVRGAEGPIFPLRGLPADLGWDLAANLYSAVVDDDKQEGFETVARSHAEAWVQEGKSFWKDGSETSVSCPDWHSYGWLTPSEWRQVIESDRLEWEANPDYFATAAAMEELERRGRKVRVVFWFCN